MMNKDLLSVMFFVSVILELIYVGLFIFTIKMPDFRFWPPPKSRSWQFFVSWLFAGLVAVKFLFIGLLDFDSFFLPTLMKRLPIALLCILFGSIIGMWSFGKFGLKSTIGLGDHLITNGPYKYSRNPQYLGDMINIIGYMFFTNSWMAWIIGILGIGLNILAPFTEEPWLEEKFGEKYFEYKRRVPRFIGKVTKDEGITP
jgi:protein-S-isoprenylcysteine O-methyltransferase Ste14